VSLSALPPFFGKFYVRNGPEYAEHAYQYATTSQPAADMAPALIVFAAGDNDEDIIAAIKYANANNLSIADRAEHTVRFECVPCADVYHDLTPSLDQVHVRWPMLGRREIDVDLKTACLVNPGHR